MGLKDIIKAIFDYEPAIYDDIKTKTEKTLFKPKTTNELQIAVNLWCLDRPKALYKYGHISKWDVSKMYFMDYLFCCTCGSCKDKTCECGKRQFNDNINEWNVSNVVNMERMFSLCENFNQPLDKWDMHNVKNIRRMFYKCYVFEQDISNWKLIDLGHCKEAFKLTKLPVHYKPFIGNTNWPNYHERIFDRIYSDKRQRYHYDWARMYIADYLNQ